MPPEYDVIVAGAGPAGSTCAAFCAAAGMKTLLLEKAEFPRDKVCGDCLNPAAWPVLDRLGVSGQVLALPHSQLEAVEFLGITGAAIRFPLHASGRGEIAIKRSRFDEVLLQRAAALGAEVRTGITVTDVSNGWRVHAGGEVFSGRFLVAADGRNSSVARLLHLLPSARKDRLALQTHLPAPPDFGERVSMRFLPHGYCGLASVGGGELNLCLVARPPNLPRLKEWAASHFHLPPEQPWRTIAPLARAAVPPAHERLVLIGDAARVVEPFTGEGIYYALATGELAAQHLKRSGLRGYAQAQRRLYRGRLWVNELSKMAALHPRAASMALQLLTRRPQLLRWLTRKVVGGAALSA